MRSFHLLLPVAALTGCGEPFWTIVTEPLETIVTAIPTYSAVSSVEGPVVEVTITAANETSHSLRYSIRVPCGVFVRVHRDAARTGPAWDQWDWLNDRPGGCKGLARERTLRPGEREVYRPTAAIADILGDSLPSGLYFISGMIVQDIPALGLIDVPAGELELIAP